MWQQPQQAPRKKDHRKFIILGVAAGLGLVVLVGVGFAVFSLLPLGQFANLNPLGDSPASVIDGLHDVVAETADEIESIEDASSRDAAVEKLNGLAERARDLQKRAIRLGTVPEPERVALVSRYNDEVLPLKTRLENAAGRVREQGLGSDQLLNASLSVAIAVSDVAMAMDVGWKELPQPENKTEELEFEKTKIRRDVWRAVACVTSEADYQSLDRELLAAAERFKGLAPLQKVVAEAKTGPTAGRSPYHEFAFGLGFQTADKLGQLQEKYGENAKVTAGLAAIKSAESNLTGIDIEAENKLAMQNIRGPKRPTPRMPPEVAAKIEQRQNRQQTNRNNPDNAPQPTNTDGPLDLGAPKGAENEGREQALRRFVNRQGLSNVVIIRVSNASDLLPGVLTKALIAELGTKAFFATRPADTAIMAIRYSGELGDVTKHIDWGRVESTDAERRLVFVDGSAAGAGSN